MCTTSDVAVPEGLPVSFDGWELLTSDHEVGVLILEAGLFDVEGRINASDLAEVGILESILEIAGRPRIDLVNLPGNDWGTVTPPTVGDGEACDSQSVTSGGRDS
jgi:hypothetical protein